MLADGFAKLFVEVISVPEVGNVILVGPVVVKVNELAPEVIRLPPKVIVLVPLFTPVPPLADGKTPAVEGNALNKDQLGAPDAVLIKMAPVVACGAKSVGELVPAPYKRLFAVIVVKPVPP